MANVLGHLAEGVPPDPSLLDTLLHKAYEDHGSMKGDVRRLTSTLVLKSSSPYCARIEAEATRFIAEHAPKIPVPRLHHHWEKEGTGYLVMDYIEGDMLQRVWRTLSSGQRETIMRSLAGFIEDLRRIPQPPPPPGSALPLQGWVGSPLGNAMADFSMTWSGGPFGPFAEEKGFSDWKVSRYEFFGQQHGPTAERIAEIRRAMADDHPVVFTHGDINRMNVLVRVTGDGPGDVEVTALLDWEQAGWRPIYWEGWKWWWDDSSPPEWAEFALNQVAGGYEKDIRLARELQLISGHIPA